MSLVEEPTGAAGLNGSDGATCSGGRKCGSHIIDRLTWAS